VLPVTSAITILRYGSEEQLIVNYQYSVFPEELPVSSLPDFVTEEGNPGNIKKIKSVCVELPIPFLRRGIEFVDTPGIGSSILDNTKTTYSFLPECDAVLFVTSADAPLTQPELEFLTEIRDYVDRIFFVVNKTDLIDDHELDKVLIFIRETIQKITGGTPLKLFPLSAQSGLSGRVYNDSELYEKSGIIALEEALEIFLSGEKMPVFFASMAEKALRIIEEEAIEGTLNPDFSEEGSRSSLVNQPLTVKRDYQAVVQEIKNSKTVLSTLYRAIMKNDLKNWLNEESLLSDSISVKYSTEKNLPVLPVETDDIAEDLRSRECPVCRHVTKKATEFLIRWQYKLGSEETTRKEFASKTGFCPIHMWQLLAVSSAHGASVGLAQLAEFVSRHLSNMINFQSAVSKVRELMRDSQDCLVCRLLRDTESEYIQKLASFIADIEGQLHYSYSQGVCIPHLGMLLDCFESAERREFLLAHEARRFIEDAEDMRSFALKSEALRRDLQNRDEEDAYVRAVSRLVSSQHLSIPWYK